MNLLRVRVPPQVLNPAHRVVKYLLQAHRNPAPQVLHDQVVVLKAHLQVNLHPVLQNQVLAHQNPAPQAQNHQAHQVYQ